jgi:hypothetical protein
VTVLIVTTGLAGSVRCGPVEGHHGKCLESSSLSPIVQGKARGLDPSRAESKPSIHGAAHTGRTRSCFHPIGNAPAPTLALPVLTSSIRSRLGLDLGSRSLSGNKTHGLSGGWFT